MDKSANHRHVKGNVAEEVTTTKNPYLRSLIGEVIMFQDKGSPRAAKVIDVLDDGTFVLDEPQ